MNQTVVNLSICVRSNLIEGLIWVLVLLSLKVLICVFADFFSVCRDFAVLEDHCLAYTLQEQESKCDPFFFQPAHMFFCSRFFEAEATSCSALLALLWFVLFLHTRCQQISCACCVCASSSSRCLLFLAKTRNN